MRFQTLGPIRVNVAGREVTITPSRERALLATLLLHANELVQTDRLIDAIWDANPPHNARNQLQGCVSRLRKHLSDAGVTGAVIVTEPAGYRAVVEPHDLDLLRFRQLVVEARAAAGSGRYGVASASYRAALALFRGPAFAGFEGHLLNQAGAAVEEERVQAIQERIEAELAGGAAGELVAELADLVRQHPHREGLHSALMLALYRAGRQADALAAYRRARQLLLDELGTEPGSELQRLHHAILNRDPALDTQPVSAQPSAASPSPKPRELPPDVAGFTGRAEALKKLDEFLPDRTALSGPVVITAIAGTAGVGKTALVVHWAHRVRDRFPDGQLFINLRGYDSDEPTAPADALTRLLSALGITGQDVPRDLDERSARYRSELADRRMLIVLDNASSVEQVRPLLPGGGSNMVVVTSRDSLAGLVAVHGAQRLELDLLPADEAVTLLRRLIGQRVDAEPEAAATLADQCARLPLALRVAAELAVSRAAVSLAELVVELADRGRRLDALDAGDLYAAVRTVFSWSIQHLPPDIVATFRLLGLHPGSDTDPYAAAALVGTELDDARRQLELISRAHLLQSTGAGRYGMHDLLRAYAAELACSHDTEQIRHAALSRLLDHYRHTASMAMDTAYPYERERRPRIPPVDTSTPDLSDPTRATGWLDIEHPNLLAAARHAADHDWPEHALDLSTILHRHLSTRGRYDDAEALHRQALTTARTVSDRTGELDALNGLGWVHLMQCRNEQAADDYQQALELTRTIGDRAGELDALNGLGWVHLMQGRQEQALNHYQQALEIARTTGDRTGERNALLGLGHIHRLQGRHEQALNHYQQALEIARTTGDRSGELNVLYGLGHIHRLQGRHEQALNHYQLALEIARTTGDPTGELSPLAGLAHIHRLQGRHEQALNHYQLVLDLARETRNRNWQFEALHGLGRVHHATGSPDAALASHQQALELATDLGQPDDQARALDGLARAHVALDQPEQARQHWQQALHVLTSLGTDHTEDQETDTSAIRAHLAALAERHRPSEPA